MRESEDQFKTKVVVDLVGHSRQPPLLKLPSSFNKTRLIRNLIQMLHSTVGEHSLNSILSIVLTFVIETILPLRMDYGRTNSRIMAVMEVAKTGLGIS